MKRTLIISLLVGLMGVMAFEGCERETIDPTEGQPQRADDSLINQQSDTTIPDPSIMEFPSRTDYLVESVSWFEDSSHYTNVIYEYNSQNQLIRKIGTGKYVEQGQVRESRGEAVYHYTDGRITSITYNNISNPQQQTPPDLFYYDEYGRLIRTGNTCYAYRNGRMDSIYYYNGDPNVYSILEYDAHGNIVREIQHYPEFDMIEQPTGNYITRIYEFEYSTGIRPDFGLDYLFGYEPIAGQGTTYPTAVRMLSPNCMTRYSAGPEIWEYEYNEHGLPITMYYQFADVVPINHPVYRFTYRHK